MTEHKLTVRGTLGLPPEASDADVFNAVTDLQINHSLTVECLRRIANSAGPNMSDGTTGEGQVKCIQEASRMLELLGQTA